MIETWKQIKGYPSYSVSNTGRVISTARKNPIELRQMVQNGYMVVGLSRCGEVKRLLVHRLVANAFVPNCMDKPQVNHKDGNKKNNRSDNLEWVTAKENICHARDLLGVDYTSHSGHQKRIVRSDGAVFKSINDAARSTGCRRGNVQLVLRGKRKRCGGYGWSYA